MKPMQPIYKDNDGYIRFKSNKIVDFLLENGGYDLNDLALMDFSQEDREQFAQLIGYSLSGFGELSYVSYEAYETAELMAESGITEDNARIVVLTEELCEIKKGLKIACIAAFGIHPDDID